VALGCLAGSGAAVLLAGLVVSSVLLLDAFTETTPQVRVASAAVAALAALAGLTGSIARSVARAGDRALAARLDAATASGGLVSTGVDLMPATRAGAPRAQAAHLRAAPCDAGAGLMTHGLSELAVHLAADTAARAPAGRVSPAAPALRPIGAAVLLAAGFAAVAWLWPDAVGMQVLRLLDPHGDHPPHSPTRFAVFPGVTRVMYGDTLDVTVRCDGLLPERMDLVVCDSLGQPVDRAPMFREDDHVWRAQVHDVHEPMAYFVRTPRGRSRRFTVDVIRVPRIDGVWFRITPPAYTGERACEGPVPKGGIAGLRGTRVEVRVTSNRPLSHGDVFLSPATKGPAPAPAGARVRLAPVQGGAAEVRGEFRIEGARALALAVVDVDGIASRDVFRTAVQVLEDARPIVRLLAPQPMSVAVPDALVPVAIEVEDDYGVAGLWLYRSLNGSRDLAAALPLPARPGGPVRHARPVVPLDLAPHGLLPGDVISLFARAVDGRPEGPGGAETSIVELMIVSPDEFARIARAQRTLETIEADYRQGERVLENLAESLAALARSLRDAVEKRDAARARGSIAEIGRIARSLDAAIRDMERTLGSPAELDLERALRIHLAAARDRLSELRQALDTAGRSADPASALGELDRVVESLGRLRDEFRAQVGRPLDLLAAVYPLMEDGAMFTALLAAQKDIARRTRPEGAAAAPPAPPGIDGLRTDDASDEPDARVRMRDLADEQRRIRDRLLALIEDIREHAARLPDEERFARLRSSAEKFAGVLARGPIPGLMDQAAGALARHDLAAAGRLAATAAEEMEKLLASCSQLQGDGQASLGFLPSLCGTLQDAVRALLERRGLGRGAGHGWGSGRGGYSMFDPRRAIGLYGHGRDPGALDRAMRDRSSGSSGRPGSRGRGGAAAEARLEDAGDVPVEEARSGGVPVRELPAAYRERIRAYMERLVEEQSGGQSR
jgi:hypothetical protein